MIQRNSESSDARPSVAFATQLTNRQTHFCLVVIAPNKIPLESRKQPMFSNLSIPQQCKSLGDIATVSNDLRSPKNAILADFGAPKIS